MFFICYTNLQIISNYTLFYPLRILNTDFSCFNVTLRPRFARRTADKFLFCVVIGVRFRWAMRAQNHRNYLGGITKKTLCMVTLQLYARGWVDPVPDPLLLRKSGSAGKRTRTSGSVASNSDHKSGHIRMNINMKYNMD
jgi:hypothetical protein